MCTVLFKFWRVNGLLSTYGFAVANPEYMTTEHVEIFRCGLWLSESWLGTISKCETSFYIFLNKTNHSIARAHHNVLDALAASTNNLTCDRTTVGDDHSTRISETSKTVACW